MHLKSFEGIVSYDQNTRTHEYKMFVNDEISDYEVSLNKVMAYIILKNKNEYTAVKSQWIIENVKNDSFYEWGLKNLLIYPDDKPPKQIDFITDENIIKVLFDGNVEDGFEYYKIISS